LNRLAVPREYAAVARAGDILENPATGERLRFLRTAAETDGELLEYELDFVPRGFAARDHLHPRQSERHEVLEGRLGLVVAGRSRELGPGDAETVPAGTQHRVYPLVDGRVRARFVLRPALESEELLETLFGLARAGKVGRRGEPNLLRLAVIFDEFRELGRPIRPSPAVQRAVFGPIAVAGRALGYRARFAEEGTRGEYVFVDEWAVDAPQEAVYDALADARCYPEWWRPVYISAETDGPPEVGRVARQHFKGRLPYHLHTTSRITRYERPDVLEAEVDGDLRGRGVWTLTRRNGLTHVRFDWRVFADRPLLRTLTPLLRPLFRWNHNWAIAQARDGLEPYARRSASRV
jgi:mannose-6-phosphate isomerase-like protein (cupin superfamily)/uncharacterized protein YndB with AHSA1/START domain